MDGHNMNTCEINKPRITLCNNGYVKEAYYKCSDGKVEAYGSTPEEAFEMWKQISSVKEWRADWSLHHQNLRDEWYRQTAVF